MPDPLRDIDLDRLAREIKQAAYEGADEDAVKIAVESMLRRYVLEPLGIPVARYQYTLASGLRPDALYGHVIIDYKRPGKLAARASREEAVRQIKGYIRDRAESESEIPRYLGVLLDGPQILFVRYRRGNWEERGPLDLNAESLGRLISALRGLKLKPLDAKLMIDDFGPKQDLTGKFIRALYHALDAPSRRRTSDLFEDWTRIFLQVIAYSPKKVEGLKRIYGMPPETNVVKLFFCLHTYYALIMKLLAAEVAVLYSGGRLVRSQIADLQDAYARSHDSLKEEIKRIESGEVFKVFLGIENFIEADYFSWYLDEWSEEVASAVIGLLDKLGEYEPGTSQLEPDYVKDLFKSLYQGLVDKTIRHDLGEYFTPDWLAELVLDRVGFTVEMMEKQAREGKDPLTIRVLDPACGSGTFLVAILKRLRAYGEDHFLEKRAMVEAITKNVVGFDLNPLAYIAARVNYLLALGDLLGGIRPGVQIPVYLADSIMVESRTTLQGTFYVLRTAVGEFVLPANVVGQDALKPVLSAVEQCIRSSYPVEDFVGRVRREIPRLDPADLESLAKFYSFTLKLEADWRDRIWTGLIRNSFAPLLLPRFDYVIGNPPWISWESLPATYREVSKPLWKSYHLMATGEGRGMGRAKRDLAMLFVAKAVDSYLAPSGKLGFLIPYTLFKSQAASGFRAFLANKCAVLATDDLVELAPFEGATNRTAFLCLNAGGTTFPVSCTSWTRRPSATFNFESSLEQVKNATFQHALVTEPIGGNSSPETPWVLAREAALPVIHRVYGSSSYEVHKGVNFNLNGAYWVRILESRAGGRFLVKNLATEAGRLTAKEVTKEVESDLLRPLIRGRDVRRWCVEPSSYTLLPADADGNPVPPAAMRQQLPCTYEYLFEFFEDMIKRGGEPYKSQLEPYRTRSFEEAERVAPPFYYVFNAGNLQGAFKVVWKEISGKVSGKANLSVAVAAPIKDRWLGRTILVPDHKLYVISLRKEEEANYLTAFLNSTPARLTIASSMIETAISSQVFRHVRVPEFNPKDDRHVLLAQYSKEAHEAAQRNDITLLGRLQQKIDETVGEIYGISAAEMNEAGESLRILVASDEESPTED